MEVGAVFSEVAEELGVEPHASSLNSGRRNGVVGTSKELDKRGMTQMLAKKLMQHKAKSGVATIEVCYDDSTSTSDMGALLCGRAMMEKQARHGLLQTRSLELIKYRTFSDVAKDDPLRLELFDNNAERCALRQEVAALKEGLAAGDVPEAEAASADEELAVAQRSLLALERRLRHQTLDQKRQAVFEADRERLGSVPLPTLRERRAVVSYEALSVRGLVARYGDVRDCAHLLPSRKRKRAKLSEAQVQMVQSGAAWNAVQKADAVAGAKRKGGAGGEENAKARRTVCSDQG